MTNRTLSLLALGLVFAACSAVADTKGTWQSCRVTAVGVNPFEEGLGVFGEYDVDSDSMDVSFFRRTSDNKVTVVSVGQMSWEDGSKGDSVTTDDSLKDKGTVIYNVTTKDGANRAYSIQIKTFAKTSRGVALLKDANTGLKFKKMAEFDCYSTRQVERAEIGESNVLELSEAAFKALPRRVLKNLGNLDIPFRMGDGYYDLKETKTYAVKALTGETAGYLVWASMSYTEASDDELVEATVVLDRNGLYISGLPE